MTSTLFNVHDMLETEGFTGPRLYEVQGIHLGALHQEDVIELLALDRSDPDAHGKKQMMLVPREMLCAGITAGIFHHTPRENQDV